MQLLILNNFQIIIFCVQWIERKNVYSWQRPSDVMWVDFYGRNFRIIWDRLVPTSLNYYHLFFRNCIVIYLSKIKLKLIIKDNDNAGDSEKNKFILKIIYYKEEPALFVESLILLRCWSWIKQSTMNL